MARIKRAEIVHTEVLPSPAPTESDAKRMLAEFVDARIAEAMAGDGAIFQPWWQPKPISAAIKRLQTVSEQQKFSHYFADHGCMRCDKNTDGHASLGFCQSCHSLIDKRLRTKVLEHSAPPGQMQADFRDTEKMARKALGPALQRKTSMRGSKATKQGGKT